MRLILALLLVPSFAFAAKIPVDIFDQSKLENLLRNIPSSLSRTEVHEGFVRHHHEFPKNKKANFRIKCYADYFGQAKFPSFETCEFDLSTNTLSGDELVLTIADSGVVNSLREAISYGDEVKKFYSTERVYGQASDGALRDLFRYAFICKRDACEVTVTLKPAKP